MFCFLAFFLRGGGCWFCFFDLFVLFCFLWLLLVAFVVVVVVDVFVVFVVVLVVCFCCRRCCCVTPSLPQPVLERSTHTRLQTEYFAVQ